MIVLASKLFTLNVSALRVLTLRVLISATDANRYPVLILLNFELPSTSNVPCMTVSATSSLNVLAIIVISWLGSDGIGRIVLIESVNVDTLIIDDRSPIRVDIIILISTTVVSLATFVGGAYGEIKNGLLLLDIKRFAFDISKLFLLRYLLLSSRV